MVVTEKLLSLVVGIVLVSASGCGGAAKNPPARPAPVQAQAYVDVCLSTWGAKREAHCLMGTVRREVIQAELHIRSVKRKHDSARSRCIDDRMQTLRDLGELGAASRWRIGEAVKDRDEVATQTEQRRLRTIHGKVVELATQLASC